MVNIEEFKVKIKTKFAKGVTPMTCDHPYDEVYIFRDEGIRITVNFAANDTVHIETYIYRANDALTIRDKYYKVGIPDPSRIIAIGYWLYMQLEKTINDFITLSNNN